MLRLKHKGPQATKHQARARQRYNGRMRTMAVRGDTNQRSSIAPIYRGAVALSGIVSEPLSE